MGGPVLAQALGEFQQPEVRVADEAQAIGWRRRQVLGNVHESQR
jgi:hypothetical protein